MPGKTQGEKLDELKTLTTTLEERLNNVRQDVEALEENVRAEDKELAVKVTRVDDSARAAQERLAVLEERVRELKENVKESASKRWAIVLAIISALVGAALSSLIQLLFSPTRH